MEDKIIECVDCHNSFVWDIGAQEFMTKLHEEWKEGLHHDDPRAVKVITPPKRCPACRIIKKAARDAQK